MVTAYATEFKTSGLTSINIGLNNDKGNNIGYGLKYGIGNGPAVIINPYEIPKFAVRASTNTTPGTAKMKVIRADVV